MGTLQTKVRSFIFSIATSITKVDVGDCTVTQNLTCAWPAARACMHNGRT